MAIVGAGITGALLADALTRDGLSVVVLDARDAGLGSTGVSTALLQYELDTSLTDLAKRVGVRDARRAYCLGLEALDEIERAAHGIACGFERRSSLYLARDEDDVTTLRTEFDARHAAGLAVRWLEGRELERRWGLCAAGAIESDAGAVVDPVRLTLALLERAESSGAAVHVGSPVTEIETDASGPGRGRVATVAGHEVRCRWVVMATGYESQAYLSEPVVELRATYALATAPINAAALAGAAASGTGSSGIGRWVRERAMVWEHDDPYLYARWAGDRIIAGGEDDEPADSSARDAAILAKAARVMERLRALAPGLAPALRVERAWAGAFGSTKDGLGYIGQPPERPGALFALGFGGNGITFSMLAARMLSRLVRGEEDPDLRLFRFGR